MKRFTKKILLFISPFLIIGFSVFLADPFKVWLPHEDYYLDYSVTLNREDVCLKLYNKNRDNYNFNSFILGSSRSQAFKTSDWNYYLESPSTPFHFDGSGEGIYGILNKLKYFDELNVTISNVLIILDEEAMTNNYNRPGHLFISPPALSKGSKIEFYKTFIEATLNVNIIYAFFDYKISKIHKDYMGWLISKFIPKGDNVTGDVWYWSYDESIKNDSIAYYSKLIKTGIFYDRNTTKGVNHTNQMSVVEKEQLVEIAEILRKHKTKYRIVISPLYDQVPISKERLEFLVTTFEGENIFDFSGKNDFTEIIGNYYEHSHYRPIVAKAIMKIIYDKNNARTHNNVSPV